MRGNARALITTERTYKSARVRYRSVKDRESLVERLCGCVVCRFYRSAVVQIDSIMRFWALRCVISRVYVWLYGVAAVRLRGTTDV